MSWDALDLSITNSDAKRCWLYLHAMVLAAANISKILWPSCLQAEQRRRTLRDMLGVPDKSVLMQKRLWNHLEHFDERIESMVVDDHNVIDSNIGDLATISLGHSVFLRNFDPRTQVLTFAGEVFEIKPLADAALELRSSIASLQCRLRHRQP